MVRLAIDMMGSDLGPTGLIPGVKALLKDYDGGTHVSPRPAPVWRAADAEYHTTRFFYFLNFLGVFEVWYV